MKRLLSVVALAFAAVVLAAVLTVGAGFVFGYARHAAPRPAVSVQVVYTDAGGSSGRAGFAAEPARPARADEIE